MEGQVAQGRDQDEAKRGQGVRKKRGPEFRRSAEKRDDHERCCVQRRDHAQGPYPLDSWDGPRVPDFPRAGEVDEVEQREPTRQDDAEDGPKQAP